MNHRIFERTLRSLAFQGACLFERLNIIALDLGLVQTWDLPALPARPECISSLMALAT